MVQKHYGIGNDGQVTNAFYQNVWYRGVPAQSDATINLIICKTCN